MRMEKDRKGWRGRKLDEIIEGGRRLCRTSTRDVCCRIHRGCLEEKQKSISEAFSLLGFLIFSVFLFYLCINIYLYSLTFFSFFLFLLFLLFSYTVNFGFQFTQFPPSTMLRSKVISHLLRVFVCSWRCGYVVRCYKVDGFLSSLFVVVVLIKLVEVFLCKYSNSPSGE